MYYYMSLCNIPFLISLKPNYIFASYFVWMFLGWTPTKFVKICYLTFGQLLKKFIPQDH